METNSEYRCYEIKSHYDNGAVSCVYLKTALIDKEIIRMVGNYVAEITDSEGKVLDVIFFNFPLIILYDAVDSKTGRVISGGKIEKKEADTIVKLPFYENAKTISVYDSSAKKLLTIDIPRRV